MLSDTERTIIRYVKEQNYNVHCLTNDVAQALTANALLAVGINPSMTQNPAEIRQFVESTDGLLINLGMMTSLREDLYIQAAHHAQNSGKSWVLDPVYVERSEKRCHYAKDLLDCKPALLRMNLAEFRALFACDFTNETLIKICSLHDCMILISGEIDYLANSEICFENKNGSFYQSIITGMGCALSAFLTGFIINNQSITDVLAGLKYFTLAADIAQKDSSGPGSFSVNFLDRLYSLSDE